MIVLLALVAVVYFGIDVAEVYFRYYRYNDAVAQEAQYGGHRADEDIRRRLIALADSLGLPDEASRRLEVRRSANRLHIQTFYTEHVDVPFFKRDLRFNPKAEHTF